MATADTIVVIQARMSSRRFPGKVLAPFDGRPIVWHVWQAVRRVKGVDQLVIATSTDPSDDPLVVYLESIGATVFRGPLDNVFVRFQLCVERFPCEWLLRVSADSPLLDPEVLAHVVNHGARPRADLVTTIFPRTFPKGQNAELIRVSTLLSVDPSGLSVDEQEHVTPFFYRRPDKFRIINVESGNPELANVNTAVDTVEDLHRLERLSVADVSRPRRLATAAVRG